MNEFEQHTPILTPKASAPEYFTDPVAAVQRLIELYDKATDFLSGHFAEVVKSGLPKARYRAFYPEIRLTTTSYASTDSRLSFGHVAQPGTYAATVTRPALFAAYLEQQIGIEDSRHRVAENL
jgi:AMP nucleosidase